jgi:hypothetical protein
MEKMEEQLNKDKDKEKSSKISAKLVLKWQGSQARKLLVDDLVSGLIPLESKGDCGMQPRDVYNMRPEFREFPYEKFRDQLRSLRNQISKKKESALSDCAALAHDETIHPKKLTNHRGELRWEGSVAQQLLRLDMNDGKHKSMKPSELYSSRLAYSEHCSLGTFREHIYQETRLRRKLRFGAHKKNATK